MDAYWLNRNVYCSDLADGVIFLDLRQERYFALSRRDGRILRKVVGGWPGRPSSPDARNRWTETERALAEALVERGLLTKSPRHRNMHALHLCAATDALGLADVARIQSPIGFRSCLRYLLGYACVCVRLWRYSLEFNIEDLRRRKARCRNACVSPSDHQLVCLLAHFLRLRAVTYTARDRCLFDSFVLADFLLRNGVLPTLVIGVAARPFGAHGWVQSGARLLNDTPEHTSSYLPILAV